jgi:hypothetical protein
MLYAGRYVIISKLWSEEHQGKMIFYRLDAVCKMILMDTKEGGVDYTQLLRLYPKASVS